MVDFRYGECLGIQEVLINSEPTHVFEFEKTAHELAIEVDGEVVELHYTDIIHLWNAEYDEDFRFIGYGVLKDGELL